MSARRVMLVVGAAGVLVSSYIHYYLYFHGGYRGISVDRVLGLDVSRSFALQAISGFLIAWVLVLSLRWTRWSTPAALVGALFAASSLVAYGLTRTSGLLGFTDDQTSIEAVIAVAAEIIAVGSLVAYLVTGLQARRSAQALPQVDAT
jgi:fucose 4-O-acetylase-like acetyltransferase